METMAQRRQQPNLLILAALAIALILSLAAVSVIIKSQKPTDCTTAQTTEVPGPGVLGWLKGRFQPPILEACMHQG
ncbi:MAG TPA: hypothetical protein VFW71_02715 [Actinomycetota bacterium]|nr:hypothetical protein [Actinomycetota bacterium]